MMKLISSSIVLSSLGLGANAFTAPLHLPTGGSALNSNNQLRPAERQTSTSLNVWWFGGTPGADSETTSTGEECELVAVRIDRTSANSRRIAGEIVVNASQMDVWSILTDYDNLSTHVPNLVKSERKSNQGGEGGDGTHQCRLYQRGAQKIIGFEFGADVTMDMTESIVTKTTNAQDTDRHPMFPEERRIDFKCVDSQFFSEFDGSWRVVQMPDNPFTGEAETTVSYSVEVRPKGPVPVAALEWRIREDVPTNLRAVKKAAIDVGEEGILAQKNGGTFQKALSTMTGGGKSKEGTKAQEMFADFILDYENETLGAYLA